MSQTLGASTSEKRRRRPPLACVACRRRKVRCDRKMPCQNCVRARRTASCTYLPDDRLEPLDGTQGFHDGINGRSSARDGVISAPLAAPSNLSPSEDVASNQNTAPNVINEAASLAKRVRMLEQQLRQVIDSKTTDMERARSAHLPQKHMEGAPSKALGDEYWDIVGPRKDTALSELDTPSTKALLAKSRYLGGSHWMHGISLFPRTNTLVLFLENLKSDRTSETYQVISASKTLGKSIKAARTPHLVSLDFGQQIPSREVADKLLEAYFRTFETVHRIIHVPSFRLEYARYWQNTEGARQAFVIQLQLCMAIGTLVQDERYSMRKLAMQWIYEARIWLLQPAEKSRIDLSGLQVWCLVHLARDLCGVSSDLVWISAGSLLRMAMYTGLHRDPEHLPHMSLLAAETRRRLWVTILEILVGSSMDSGGPPLITMDDFDTKPPGNYNDKDLLGENDPARPAPLPGPLTTFTDTSIQIALLRSIGIRLQIATYLNEYRSVQSYDRTLALNSDLTLASRHLDAALRVYQSQKPGPTGFQLAVTEQIIKRYSIALHLPWLGPSKNDPRYYFSHKMCVDIGLWFHKTGMAHGFLGAEGGQEADDVGRLHICAASGYRYIGTQCLLVLVIELIWELEEQRTAVHRSDSDELTAAAAATDASRTPAIGFGLFGYQRSHSSDIFEVVRQSTEWMKARMMAGEVNVKGYLFAAAMHAEASGLQKGLSDTELAPLVHEAAKKAAETSYNILEGLYAVEVGDNTPGPAAAATRKDGARAPRDPETEGTQTFEPAAEVQSFDPGSSGSWSEWDWDALVDPNYSFNLNLGAMDLVFGSEGI